MSVGTLSRTFQAFETADPDELPPLSRLLLVILAESADGVCGYASPPVEALAMRTGMNRQMVQHHLMLLVKSGDVTIQKSRGLGGRDLYIIHPRIGEEDGE